MNYSSRFTHVWHRLVSVLLVFALFVGIFPARIIHAEDPEEDLFVSETAEDMAEDYAVWPYATLPEEDDHLDDEDANITEENLLNRNEAIKDFRLDNGMNVAVSYPYSVHYKENEEWKEIDNTLKSIENDKGVFYHNQAGMWDVYLPQVLSKDHSVIVSKEGNALSFSFEGELYNDDEITTINETTGVIEEKEYPEEYDEPDMQVLKKIVSSVDYTDIYEDTDLRYDLISNCLKETVILNSYKEGLTGYQYRLDSEDLVLQLQEDKTILAYKKDELDGDPVFWLPAPFLYDSKGEYSHDIEMILTKEENGYLLSYGLPSDWLSDSEREYPVRLDPIVQPTASYQTINDVDVPENHSPEYLDTILGIGYNARYTNGHRERVLMRFNSIPDLSSADIVVKGEIILYNTLVQYAMPIEAHEVYENWQSNTVAGKAFMAGAFNIFSFGSPEIVKRFAANMSRIGKKAFEFFFSVGMDFYNDVVDRAIDSIGETTGVSIGRAPNVPVFNGHSGGGKLVMARV